MNVVYVDASMGASGDMIVGALLDLGADFEALQQALTSLGVEGYQLHARSVTKGGIAATQFTVELDPGIRQPHRHLRHVVEIIESGSLPEAVKAASIETFERIAEAEARVHGTTIEKVHFHEVGAVDSIVDVVGAHWARHALGIERFYVSPLHVGAGTIECAHGTMPVPAPATALLLEGAPCYGGDVQTELVTPTGAALLTQWAEAFGPMPMMQIGATGYGSGTKDVPGRANVLRMLRGQMSGSEETTPITVIETTIDDMTPELLAPALAAALEAGARDAFIAPVFGKKGRPAHLITLLCGAAQISDMVGLLFRHTSTFGVRMRTEERVCLERDWREVTTPWGPVRIKMGYRGGEIIRRAPEFEDCRVLAEEKGVAVTAVYEAALAAAVKGELTDAR